jgi:murein DD-endopeptidase MepM/ murein hydrolase activator NlpD
VRALLLAMTLAADPRAQLEALEARRAAEREAARRLGEKERSILDTLDDAERAWRDAEGRAQRAEHERAESAARLEQAVRDEEAMGRRWRELVAGLRPRLAARQRMDRVGELGLVASAGSLAELVKRRALLDRILAHDAGTLRAARQALRERERATAGRLAEAERLALLAERARDGRAEAARRREERRALLASVRGAREVHERAAAEADGQARKLADFIAALPPPRAGQAPYGGFAQLRGRLPRPAAGPLQAGFGKVVNPRFRTVTVQNGIEIGAARGEPVHAVAPGQVVHAGWFKGYGNLVIVDHGEGFHTLVAHLESMSAAAGEEVAAGALLGTVGDSGSLRGPHLYFELREKGRPVDPRPWLAP